LAVNDGILSLQTKIMSPNFVVIVEFTGLTPIIGYAEHFVVHQTHQIYSLGLMRAKAVDSKNHSETEFNEVNYPG
jgi:hypothetical protein